MNNYQLVIELKNGKKVYSVKSRIPQVLLWRKQLLENIESRNYMSIQLENSTSIIPVTIKNMRVISDSNSNDILISSIDVVSCMFVEPYVHYMNTSTGKIYQFSLISNDFEVLHSSKDAHKWSKTSLNFEPHHYFVRLGKDSVL